MTNGRKILSIDPAKLAVDQDVVSAPESQFEFLTDFPFLHEHAAMAEALAVADPRGAAMRARLGVEALVRWLYDHDDALRFPYEKTLNALTSEPSFRNLVGTMIGTKISLVRKIGNRAAHPGNFADSQAVSAVRELFHIGYWFASHYSQNPPPAELGFAADHLPQNEITRQTTSDNAVSLEKQVETANEALEKEKKERLKDAASRAQIEAELAAVKAEFAAIRLSNDQADARHDYAEAKTRDEFIDLLLHEAGWPLDQARDIEFEVSGMPTDSGVGFVDYVLWGDDGKPLAVVEAKRSRKDSRTGKKQAELYADCLEAQFEQRPIIFYTNGYDHWIWDDQRHPPREVQGFLTKDELQLIVQRRGTRLPLSEVATNRDIAAGAGRTYQEKAIRAVAERFEDGENGGENQRKALLVMATGSGKTRTVIALSDVLMRANWAKRILFLADRKALVRQATGAFKEHLPGSATINLLKEKQGEGRVFVSTYQTMMTLIEKSRQEAGQRFGPGFFDLIVIDEAHRSVYRKYRTIFDWFDSYLIGLTATPKADVDKNTYDLFELETGVPTEAYDLTQAVNEGFLVPPKAMDVPLQFPRDGIRYSELPEEEKDEWDAKEWGEDGPPDEVGANDINTFLFNEDTIDKMLEQLMRDGIKVGDGDVLGKTIIFAKNHKHAEFIVERFDANYPHYKGKFCALVDNTVSYAETVIDDFSEPEKLPQIAVSVDMLDTGIDIPDVVNLVLFKIVRSKSKFWQMIGRGTRLREDLFGPGEDKQEFYVFDYLGNFEFFNADISKADPKAAIPLGERLFNTRVDLIGYLKPTLPDDSVRDNPLAYKAESPSLLTSLEKQVRSEIDGMPLDNFIVRSQRRFVEKFQAKEAWINLSEEDRHELQEYISGLPTSIKDPDFDARRFDLLCLYIQLALLKNENITRLSNRFKELMHALEGKESVDAVRKEMPLIQEAQTDEYWTDITPETIELARTRLRGLMQLIESVARVVVKSNFVDTIGEVSEIEIADLGDASSLVQFRRKAKAYLDQHLDNLTIARLRQGKPLTTSDLDQLESIFVSAGICDQGILNKIGKTIELPQFVRSLIGLDREAAKLAFNVILDNSVLSSRQIDFIEQIIDHLTQNGSMDPGLLYKPPYTDQHPHGVSDVFDMEQVQEIVETIRDFEPRFAS